jgi:hypothetical protein
MWEFDEALPETLGHSMSKRGDDPRYMRLHACRLLSTMEAHMLDQPQKFGEQDWVLSMTQMGSGPRKAYAALGRPSFNEAAAIIAEFDCGWHDLVVWLCLESASISTAVAEAGRWLM